MGKDSDNGLNRFNKPMDRRTALKIMEGITLGSILAACGGGVQAQTQPAETAPVPASSAKSPVGTITSNPDGNIKEFTPTSLQPTTPEQAATLTDTLVVPTKTPEGVDYSQAFSNDPQNKEDMNNKSMEAPTDPVQRAEWVKGYLAAVDNKLESGSYTGIIIKPADIASIDRQRNVYIFYPINLKPIGTYKYRDANGNWLLVKTYPVEDPTKKDGDPAKYGSFSLTDTFENNIHVRGDDGVADPDVVKPTGLEVWYANDALKKNGWAPLAASILPPNVNDDTPFIDFFLGRGIKPGLETETLVNGGWNH